MAIPRFRVATVVAALLLVSTMALMMRQVETPAVRALGSATIVAGEPSKLYEGDYSHGDLGIGDDLPDANANPAPGGFFNGYCFAPGAEGDFADPAYPHGFSVENGAIIDTDISGGGDADSELDDRYCVVIQAGPVVPTDPEDPLNGTLTVTWHFVDQSGAKGTRDLVINTFKIELEGIDNYVGGVAEVCTVNWDGNVLTGAASNREATGTFPDPLGDLPDPRDEVALGDGAPKAPPLNAPVDLDWYIDGGSPVPTTIDKLLPRVNGDGEHCITFSSDTASTDVLVTLQFDAVYRVFTNTDDQPHAETGSVSFAPPPGYAELRHLSPGGAVASEAISPVNVVGSLHTVCLVPTDINDTLLPSGVYITGPGGVTNLNVFRNNGELEGVPSGTLCFSWTATAPGYQYIQATVTLDGTTTVNAVWDYNSDGNYNDPEQAAEFVDHPLIKRWGIIEKTEITDGKDPEQNIVTGGSIERSLQFNIIDGTFAGQTVEVTEWVFGLTGENADLPAMLDGVFLEARIVGQCGYFLTEYFENFPITGQPTVMEGRSVAGRFDLDPASIGIAEAADGIPDDISISVINDPDCNPRSVISLEIRAYYPEPGTNMRGIQFDGVETLDISFRYITPEMTPRLAWAGQTVTLTYAFGGSCDAFLGQTIQFTRPDDQPGSFLPGPGVVLNGPNQAIGAFDGDCSFSVQYESEEPGEVDIVAQILGADSRIAPNFEPGFSKVVFPIFYMLIEDVRLSSTPELIVSGRGDLTAEVRGWFPGTNLSGRERIEYEDGRVTPADRWVLPDDWSLLRGDSESRRTWGDFPAMPLSQVTFLMENEGVVNQYPGGPDNGAAGWFLLDGTEFYLDVNPRTNQESVLGSEIRPRIITDLTDGDGVATVDSIGDLNLNYKDCPVNAPTGNPHCDIDDVVGQTVYYAIADYPYFEYPFEIPSGTIGKHPPVRSNTSETTWRWAGYKRVTIEDGPAPSLKYVVAHLKDRDGFCDAYFQHNTLGIQIEFQMDSGGGRIIEVEGQPSTINLDFRGATGTTYDTKGDNGEPLNEDISKPVILEDECQAWVRVSSSLLTTTNILVTFPGQNAPVPGDIRITSLKCEDETVTVTNMDDHPVSLAGFGIRSLGRDFTTPEEHLDLIGLLQPGESKTFTGGPEAPEKGWIFANDFIWSEGGDYARLVWNEKELSRITCAGQVFNPPFSPDVPQDGEGPIIVDVIVPFSNGDDIPLSLGWNLVSIPGESIPVADALGPNADKVTAIYGINPATGQWERYITGGPAYASNIQELRSGGVYWVLVKQPFSLGLSQ